MIQKVGLSLHVDAAPPVRPSFERRLRRAYVGKIVDHYLTRGGKEGYCIEIFNALCHSLAITGTRALEPLRKDEFLCTRPPPVGL